MSLVYCRLWWESKLARLKLAADGTKLAARVDIRSIIVMGFLTEEALFNTFILMKCEAGSISYDRMMLEERGYRQLAGKNNIGL